MSQTAQPTTEPAYRMYTGQPDGKIEERDLLATTREDAAVEFMGICRVLSVKTAYVLEVKTEVIVKSFANNTGK
ncbi:MAG: hypothetical protein J0I99_00595 [Devosia sp.]|uniref:hypothetical protein n=1 Tax=Devosia sp. TaxID=1871048 RepID=UPI001ACC5472|nr:hypothetical protein [Devosia sp.]MBN9314215.1 hypothetical protein [Devosia sp.]